MSGRAATARRPAPSFEDDPLWYRDAVLYELHVRAFCDSNGDGIGDFPGLTSKLDYLQTLGVTALWLLPFYPSPLRDDGYDIADYTRVHPDYGTLRDFKTFLREAHARGLRVITELVVNHTSDQHPWFQRARRARPGSAARSLYVWSDTPERYRDARIIFQDFESSNWTWDPVARAYYWHRFYSHQPDLNYDNPRVQALVLRALEFWLGQGVDGLRLDAVPYLYERDGTSCENLPETHAFLRRLRAHVDRRFSSRMLLAEANQWPEDARAYFGDGDECHMAYHFPVMPRLFMAVHMEDRFPLVDIIQQTPAIPEGCQWALFLRNHDELTLEMVTDEERDYMYRVYGRDPRTRVNLGIRRRLAPLLGNNRRRIELLNGLLFSLPGTPIIYYGDEIGMGDNFYLGDRNGVRTPMQWSPDRNAGFSRANPQTLYLPTIIDPEYHFQAHNVEAQHNNPHSLLWWTRRLIALRKRHPAFGRGELEMLYPENTRVLAFVRTLGGERILVVANLSRFVQHVELDLSGREGLIPIELFGRTELPAIGAAPYALTLGPHAFYWLSLEAPSAAEAQPVADGVGPELPEIVVSRRWRAVFADRARPALEDALAADLPRRRWFAGKSQRIKGLTITDVVALEGPEGKLVLVLAEVELANGEPATYALPLTFATGEDRERLLAEAPGAAVARVKVRGGDDGLLADAWSDPALGTLLLDAIRSRRRFKSDVGEVTATPTAALRRLVAAHESLVPTVARGEQSNSSLFYSQRLALKLFRRVAPGTNPELEVGRFLTERGFEHAAPVAGALEYRRGKEVSSLAVLQAFVGNQGDGWRHARDSLLRYFERVLSQRNGDAEAPGTGTSALLELAGSELPHEKAELIGTYVETARLLGRRTAELHLALASEPDDPAFAPEPFTALYQRSVHQSMRTLADHAFTLLARRIGSLPEFAREDGRRVLAQREAATRRFAAVLAKKITAQRTRTHGDYHLGQLLHTGKDFVIIDFEGEPARSIGERRLKRSPLRDVAGMLRSFHYAAYSALLEQHRRGLFGLEAIPGLLPWVRAWHARTGAAFLNAYLETASAGEFLPRGEEELVSLLDAYVLEKALYEVEYELDNRPDWAPIPLRGILALMGDEA